MVRHNDDATGGNSQRERNSGGQQEPLSGSHKVKNRKHTRQKNHAHHDQ